MRADSSAISAWASTSLSFSAPVGPTDAGSQLYGRIRTAIAGITDRLWGDLAPEDLTVAGRVLGTVLERANAELARG